MTMKKTIYVVAESYWSGSGYMLGDASVFFDKEEAEKYYKESNNADCSCNLFEKEIDIEITLKESEE